MRVADQVLPGPARRRFRRIARQPQDVIGIAGRALHQARAHDAETALVQPELIRDMGQERILAAVIAAIGDRDLKQRL